MNCKKCGHLKSLHNELECKGSFYIKETKEFFELAKLTRFIKLPRRSIEINKIRMAQLNYGGLCSCEGFVE